MSHLMTEVKRHLIIKYVIIPVLAPLFLAGFVLAVCTISLLRKESVFPTAPPWGVREPFATAALAILCMFASAGYFAWMGFAKKDFAFLGYSRQFWRILVTSTFAAAILLAFAFFVLILSFTRGG